MDRPWPLLSWLYLLAVASFLFLFVIILATYSDDRRRSLALAGMDTKQKSPSVDQHLLYPAKPEDLWVRVNEKILARRLAYFDDRNSSHVTVVFNIMYNDEFEKELYGLYALLKYKDDHTFTRCFPLEYWSASGDRFARRRYKEIWYNYVVRTSVGIPYHSSPLTARLSTDEKCRVLSETIPILDSRTNKKYNYGVCLHKSIYNMTDSRLLVHWVELNLVLGVEFMTIYLQGDYVPESFHKTLFPYIEQGIVEVLDWGLKPPVIPSYTKFWGQTAVITECHYRNLYRMKYLGLYDLDEFFVPQENLTIPDMIRTIEMNERARMASSYVVHNAFFYKREQALPEIAYTKKCPEMEWPSYYMYTVRSSRPKEQHEYHKLIIKPKAVISTWTHWVNKWYSGYIKAYPIPTSVALTQHYRYSEKKPLTINKVVTFTISRYFNQTSRRIIDRLCNKGGHDVD